MFLVGPSITLCMLKVERSQLKSRTRKIPKSFLAVIVPLLPHYVLNVEKSTLKVKNVKKAEIVVRRLLKPRVVHFYRVMLCTVARCLSVSVTHASIVSKRLKYNQTFFTFR